MIDLANLQEVEEALKFDAGHQLINGKQLNVFCPICYVAVPSFNGMDTNALEKHGDYHRAMAIALTNAADVAATIKSLTGGAP